MPAQPRDQSEDLNDLRDLKAAIARNAGQPLPSWDEARQPLELTDEELALAAREADERSKAEQAAEA